MRDSDVMLPQSATERWWRVAATVGLVALVLAGCSDDEAALDDRPVTERTAELSGTASFEPPWYRTAVDLAPTTRYVLPTGETVAISEALAVGRITAVSAETGLSYAAGPDLDGETPTDRRVPFNDAAADLDVVRFTMAVDRSVTAEGAELPPEVAIGLAVPGPTDLESLSEALLALGEIGVILEANARTAFTWSTDLYGIAGTGAYLGTVEEGAVTFQRIAPSPHGFAAETVPLDDLFTGAGTITLVDNGSGGLTRPP